MSSIYLDHSATTPLHPEVLNAMLPYLQEHFGNPSSIHSYGRAAKNALNDARDRMAQRLGCMPSELVFTSGGTESDNMALLGIINANGNDNSNKHIITTQVEHHAVLGTCRFLEQLGCSVTYLPVDSRGQISIEDVEAAIRPETVLISMIYGNNEVGTIQPIEAVGQLARSRDVYFHVDAVQALGVLEIDLSSLPVDLMSFSSHKINGPKGIGALYIARDIRFQPMVMGGSQERKRRAGTENLPGIIGFAKALDIATDHIQQKRIHLNELRETMVDAFLQELGEHGFIINGHPTERLPHILNISFPSTDTETMLMNLDLEGIAAASGSACTSGSLELSHVLQAMNCSEDVATSAIRFSFGITNTIEEVNTAAHKTATIARRIRSK